MPNENKPAPHKHKWKHYPGALGYETFKCSICNVDQADIRSNITLEDLNKLEEHAALEDALEDAADTLEAIKARINGEWDNPKLVKFGALGTNTMQDCLRFVEIALTNVAAVRGR